MSEFIEYRLAQPTDLELLKQVGDDLFDHPILDPRAVEFLHDDRHLLMMALASEGVVGMASGVIYVHPDKEPSLFINEVGVLEPFQGKGIGKELVQRLTAIAFEQQACKDAWVLTDKDNIAAQKTYLGAGGVPANQPAVLFEFQKKKPT